MCSRPRRRKDDGDDDDNDDDGDDGDEARGIDYFHDDTKEEDLEIWSVSGMTEFKGLGKHEVNSPSRIRERL